MAQDEQDLEALTADFVADNYGRQGGSTYVIPVVFHVIHENGPENISDAQIHDAMRILNDDFNQLNLDWDDVNPAFVGLVGNIGIEFRLAQKDPNGNCTKGITRTESPLTNDGTQTMKDLIQWPRNQYMNVWVVDLGQWCCGVYLYARQRQPVLGRLPRRDRSSAHLHRKYRHGTIESFAHLDT